MTREEMKRHRTELPVILPEEARQNQHLYPGRIQNKIREELRKLGKE
jgi:hypothetical protein